MTWTRILKPETNVRLMTQPNILWICTDQQRWDTIRCLGNKHINTPNIDRLASEGVAFTQAFAQCPVCTPSRASFLTGMYPSSIRACMNGNDYWADAAPLVPKLLSDNGYDCGLSGKLHLAGAQGRVEPRGEDGYSTYHWSHDSIDRWETGHEYADWLKEKGHDLSVFNSAPETMPPDLHQTTWCADKAIAFMKGERNGPWLFSVNPFDPHPPFDPPGEYLQRYSPNILPDPLWRDSDISAHKPFAGSDGFFENPRSPEELDGKSIKAAYYAMVELVDHNVGRMLDALEDTGQRENTIVIFTSDHGELLGDHGFHTTKGCAFFEGSVRVPLIMSWPGHFHESHTSDALVQLIDIAPTLLEYAGVQCPIRMQGSSLNGILQSNSISHRDYVFSEYFRDQTLSPHLRPNFEGSYATMIRNRRYKLIAYHNRNIGRLYDLEQDPHEFDNLWSNPKLADIRAELMQISFNRLALAVDVGPKPTTGF